MKKVLFFFLVLLLMAAQLQFNFSAAAQKDDSDPSHIVRSLEKRSELWNDLLEGKISADTDLELLLSAFVAEPLLSTDVKIFNQLQENPTSYEKICGLELVAHEKVKQTEDEALWQVTIRWKLEGYDGAVSEEIPYQVWLVKQEEQWLLKDYQVKW